ncbi:MAG: DUF6768 family protein [Verrucomicrobiales bacterium]
MIRIWYWLEMGRRSVSREIKRLELQKVNFTNQ